MKKVLITLSVILIFSSWQNENNAAAVANSNEKVTICHRTGNGESHAIEVSINAVPAHLAHGDKFGDCRTICCGVIK